MFNLVKSTSKDWPLATVNCAIIVPSVTVEPVLSTNEHNLVLISVKSVGPVTVAFVLIVKIADFVPSLANDAWSGIIFIALGLLL